jgi:LysM repeat protein
MKWRHWSILIIMVLLNYIIFSTAFNIMAKQRQTQADLIRTPQPTFQATLANPVAWIVVPTYTPRATADLLPPSPTPTAVIATQLEATPTPEAQEAQDSAMPVTLTPEAPTQTPEPASVSASSITHRIKSGETLSEIAATYQVSMQSIVQINGLDDPSHIVTGQDLMIPQADEGSPAAAPTATTGVQPTHAPTSPPTATARPPATKPPPPPTPTPARSAYQFTGQFIWDPMVAPNCAGPAVSKLSVVQDRDGNPVDGVRVEVDCYGNKWQSHPSGNPGEYEPGHFDFSFGQSVPQDWTCTMQVLDIHGRPVESSTVLTLQFDTNDCKPYGTGHQVVIVKWTKNW